MRTIHPQISAQGDTGTPSVIGVQFRKDGVPAGLPQTLRVRVCDSGGFAVATNATIAPGVGCLIAETHTADKDLTIFGRQQTTAAGTFTLATKPTANDTVTIGGKTYKFVASATVTGNVAIGADAAAAQANLLTAVNTGDAHNAVNPDATLGAFDADVAPVTAKTPGASGNAVETTSSLTAGGDGFAAETLTGGETWSGALEVIVTDATAENVTLRFCPPSVSPEPTDYTPTLELQHS